MSKEYLGDGAYVDFDGFSLILTAEDGVRISNRVVLNPEVYYALVRYATALSSRRAKPHDEDGISKS